MTRSEFDAWFDHHCSRFTGVEAWLAKFPEIGSGATQKAILDGWYLAVSNLSLANACWASDQMFASATKPRSFDDHPAKIVELNRNAVNDRAGASAQATERYSRECICEGEGMVEVANDGQFVMLDGSPNPHPYTFVACRCERGQWLNDRRTEHKLPVHDPDLMRLGATVRAETSRANLERLGIAHLPFDEQVKRVLKRAFELPKGVLDDLPKSGRPAKPKGDSKREAEIAARYDAVEDEVVEGVPF